MNESDLKERGKGIEVVAYVIVGIILLAFVTLIAAAAKMGFTS